MTGPRLLPAEAKELAMEGGKQPGFHFGTVAQLVALVRPDAKGLLGEITSIRLIARHAEGELVQWRIIGGHQTFEVCVFSHIPASIMRVLLRWIVPQNISGNKYSFSPSH
jgi:hypothetical protein